MTDINPRFARELLAIGILAYREQETLWDISQRCARTTGVPLAGAGAILGLKAGTVTVPGVGAVPAAVAGALVGLAAGTASCVMLNLAVRRQLQTLARSGTWP